MSRKLSFPDIYRRRWCACTFIRVSINRIHFRNYPVTNRSCVFIVSDIAGEMGNDYFLNNILIDLQFRFDSSLWYFISPWSVLSFSWSFVLRFPASMVYEGTLMQGVAVSETICVCFTISLLASSRVDILTRMRVLCDKRQRQRPPRHLVKSQCLWARSRSRGFIHLRSHLRRIVRGRVPRDLNFGYVGQPVRHVNP